MPISRVRLETRKERTPEAISRMRREIERLTQLVSSLLEMTSAEGDPTSRKSQTVAMDRLLEEVVNDCKVEADARGVQIESSVISSGTVEGDPELLRRAVENILRNAIRHSPSSSSITVRLKESAGLLKVSVRDFGPGVPTELLEKTFTPFYRVDGSRESSKGGVGLGLSIASRAVLLHHGSIIAENASPGLRVEIRFPGGST